MILAGDIGGTNARVSLFSSDGKRPLATRIVDSRKYASLEEVVGAFLADEGVKVDAACFGIAGPVIGGRCVATNLPWIVDASALAEALAIPGVALINDLVALGLGALTLDPSRLRMLQGDLPPRNSGGNLAIIAAGTGLGEAALVWDGRTFVPLATEGGHVDFAPRDDLEWELCTYLREKVGGRVSYERILSGPGIGNIYDFFVDFKRVPERDDVAHAIATAPDRNLEITRRAAAGDSAAGRAAIDCFVGIYGAEAGNLALKTLAVGGVYVAGSIAVGLGDRLADGAFVKAFRAKGRMGSLLESVPVALVLDADIGLAGSAFYASRGL